MYCQIGNCYFRKANIDPKSDFVLSFETLNLYAFSVPKTKSDK